MILKTASKAVRLIVELVVIVVVAFALSFLLRQFVVGIFTVPSGSMESTIEIGDNILSEKISYYFGSPQRGDIVTFVSPIQDEEANDTLSSGDEIFVKRVIAIGGDTVDIRDGYVYVNGTRESGEYVKEAGVTYTFTTTYEDVEIDYPYTVPEGEIWVMGDNRQNSKDSRYFGSVEVSSVTGHVFFRYWPFDRFGFM